MKQGVGHRFDLWAVSSIRVHSVQGAGASLWTQALSDKNAELEVAAPPTGFFGGVFFPVSLRQKSPHVRWLSLNWTAWVVPGLELSPASAFLVSGATSMCQWAKLNVPIVY